MPDRPDACARCRRPADESRPHWRAVGDELVCPGCLSSLESETAPLAPASPIDRYLKELGRDLEVGPLRRRRIVAEVGQHLRESSREQAEEHDLSRWQSERAAIIRMGSVDAIVAAYELSQPSSRRPMRTAVVALTGSAVLVVGAVGVMHHRRPGDHPAAVAMSNGCVVIYRPADEMDSTLMAGTATYTFDPGATSRTVCPASPSASKTATTDGWAFVGPRNHIGYSGASPLPAWFVRLPGDDHTARVLPLPRASNPIHVSTLTKEGISLPFFLGGRPHVVSLRIVGPGTSKWYKKYDQHHEKSGVDRIQWHHGWNSTGRPATPGTYWWYVAVQWPDGSWTYSNSEPIHVTD